MSEIQVHPAGTKIAIDREKHTIGTLFPGSLGVRDVYSLSEKWILSYRNCRVCGKELDDAAFAVAYWRHEAAVCSTTCLRKETLARYACCDKAEVRGCVCTFSTSCPDHGNRCFGTHD